MTFRYDPGPCPYPCCNENQIDGMTATELHEQALQATRVEEEAREAAREVERNRIQRERVRAVDTPSAKLPPRTREPETTPPGVISRILNARKART